MTLPKITSQEVNAFFELVVPRANGEDTPENYYPVREEGVVNPYPAMEIVSVVCAKKIEAAGSNLLLSLLFTGFLMGREFAEWKKGLGKWDWMEEMMKDGPSEG